VYALSKSELAEHVAEAGGSGEALDAATRRLEAVDESGGAKRRRLLRRWGMAAILVVAVLLVIPVAARKLDGLLALRAVGELLNPSLFSGGSSARQQEILERRLTRDLNEDERAFLLASDSRPAPEDPAMYADFLAHRLLGGRLPGDVLERAGRIDPENAHFLLLVAGETAKDAVKGEKRPVTGSGEKPSILSDWEVVDEEAVKEALELAHRAAEMPRCDSYESEIMSRRLRLLPAHEDIPTGILRSSFLAAQPSSRFGAMRVGKVLSAEAQRLADAGDRDGLKRLVGTWEVLAAMLAEDSHTLIDVLIARAFAQQVGEHLLEGCRKLGLEEEEQRLEPVVENLKAIREQVQERRKLDTDAERRITLHAGALAAMTLPALASVAGEVTPPTLEELEPGRMAEHALIDQLVALAMAVLSMLAALGIRLFLVMRPRGLRALGDRLELLWSARDLAWITLIGVLLPAAGWFLLTRWLPTSGREFGPRLTMFLVPGVQAVCLLAVMWTSLLQAVRWRLRKRGEIIGVGEGRLGPGWLMAGLCLVGAGLPGLTLQVPAGGAWWLRVSGGLAAVALIGLTVWAGRALFGGHRRALGRQLAGLALLPGLVLMALLFAAAVPLFEREERDWVARDELMGTDPERPAMTSYEWEVTQAARKELQGVLR